MDAAEQTICDRAVELWRGGMDIDAAYAQAVRESRQMELRNDAE